MKNDVSNRFNMYVLDSIFSVICNEIQYRQRVAVGPCKTKLYIYNEDNSKHNLPHAHLEYSKVNIVISILDCTIIKGKLKGNNRKQILKWVHKTRPKLIEVWNDLNPKRLITTSSGYIELRNSTILPPKT